MKQILQALIAYLTYYTDPHHSTPSGEPWGLYDPESWEIMDAKQTLQKVKTDQKFAEHQVLEQVKTALDRTHIKRFWKGKELNGSSIISLMNTDKGFRQQMLNDKTIIDLTVTHLKKGLEHD